MTTAPIAAAFIASVIVAFTFLATVHWARWGDDPPRYPLRARQAPVSRPQAPSRGSRALRDAPRPARARSGRSVPAWAHTQPNDYQEPR